MKHKFLAIFWLTAIACMFFSCSTSKPFTNGLSPSEIKAVQFFQPVSQIGLINKGNRIEPSDSLSEYSKNTLLEILGEMGSYYPVETKLSAETDDEQLALNGEIIEFFEEVHHNRKNIRHVIVPPLVYNLLKTEDQRFGLLTAARGFTRRKGNYGGQVLKSIGIGILTMGMYYPIPIKSETYVAVIIVDNHNGEVVFYRRSYLPEKDPLNKAGLTRQLENIFKGYFIEESGSSKLVLN